MIKALIWNIFINQKTLGAFDTTRQKLDKILVFNCTDQIDFIKELVHPLSRIEKQSFHRDNISIRKSSFVD
ncbi:hypothetical protein HanRHA438_Chr09g0398101 [Helianthus annuus]|nr:hypothetical protein HanRHA438_Chr09g0398101 [Helianthus annuus]